VQFTLGSILIESSYDGLYYDGIHSNNGFKTQRFEKRVYV
jgi:hypothetical protein